MLPTENEMREQIELFKAIAADKKQDEASERARNDAANRLANHRLLPVSIKLANRFCN